MLLVSLYVFKQSAERDATTEPAAHLVNVIATRTGPEHAATCVHLDTQAAIATQVELCPCLMLKSSHLQRGMQERRLQ
jgi:hypothetical protein